MKHHRFLDALDSLLHTWGQVIPGLVEFYVVQIIAFTIAAAIICGVIFAVLYVVTREYFWECVILVGFAISIICFIEFKEFRDGVLVCTSVALICLSPRIFKFIYKKVKVTFFKKSKS